jgi:hypothetical protein
VAALTVAILSLTGAVASAQSHCDGSLRRFRSTMGSGGGDLHGHFYHLDPTTGAIHRGLGDGEHDAWGAIFGYWDDGECGYHMDAYVVHFERRPGVSDSTWTRAPGAWAPASFRHRLTDVFLGWERGQDRYAWTRTMRGWAITVVDLTKTWTLTDPYPPRRRSALMDAAAQCIPP